MLNSADKDAIVAALSDRLDIMDLASRFETTFDRGELEKHMDCWTEGLVFESPYMGNLYSRADYRTALQKFYDDLKTKGGTRHLMTNFEFELTGGEARVRSYLSVFNRMTGAMLGIVEWQDHLVRRERGWLYSERRQFA